MDPASLLNIELPSKTTSVDCETALDSLRNPLGSGDPGAAPLLRTRVCPFDGVDGLLADAAESCGDGATEWPRDGP